MNLQVALPEPQPKSHPKDHARGHQRLDTLGARICAVRAAAKLTVGRAAEAAGVSRQTFSKWQRDAVQECNVGALRRFCSATDINLDWLVTGRGRQPSLIAMTGGDGEDRQDINETLAIPEITGSMAAHAKSLNLAAIKHWTIPADVLTLSFNSEPGHAVIQRVVASDRICERGDYLLIDISRTEFDDSGTYLVTSEAAPAAFRIAMERNDGVLTPKYEQASMVTGTTNWRELKVLGRVMAVVHPT